MRFLSLLFGACPNCKVYAWYAALSGRCREAYAFFAGMHTTGQWSWLRDEKFWNFPSRSVGLKRAYKLLFICSAFVCLQTNNEQPDDSSLLATITVLPMPPLIPLKETAVYIVLHKGFEVYIYN